MSQFLNKIELSVSADNKRLSCSCMSRHISLLKCRYTSQAFFFYGNWKTYLLKNLTRLSTTLIWHSQTQTPTLTTINSLDRVNALLVTGRGILFLWGLFLFSFLKFLKVVSFVCLFF